MSDKPRQYIVSYFDRDYKTSPERTMIVYAYSAEDAIFQVKVKERFEINPNKKITEVAPYPYGGAE